MKNIRKYQKPIAFFFVFNLAMELLMPLQAYALTGGPSQPEVQSFAPVDVSEMVDPFSGDFSYNLPLLDIDGYPININYNSGVTTDAEASWVGLGWNLNPGVINRSMRGLPDDFGGEEVVHYQNMKPNRTYGVSVGWGSELFGFEGVSAAFKLSYNLGINYNNYNGIGFEQSIKPSISVGNSAKGRLNFGLGLSTGGNGLTISPDISYESQTYNNAKRQSSAEGNIGVSFNSRGGLSQLTIGVSGARNKDLNDVKIYKKGKGSYMTRSRMSAAEKNKKMEITSGGLGGALSIGMNSYTPAIQNSMLNQSYTVSIKAGVTIYGIDGTGNITGYFSGQRLSEKEARRKAYGYINAEQAQTGGNYDNSALMDFNREKDGYYTKNTPSLPVTNFTYDILNVSGQGVAGTYRPFRNDIGTVYDPANRNLSVGLSGGGEVGTANLVKGGVDIHVSVINSRNRIWTESNDAKDRALFRKSGDDYSYEPYVYRQAGELSVDDEPEFSEGFDKSNPVRLKLEDVGGFEVNAKPYYVNHNGTELLMPSKNYRSKRVKRSQAMTILKRHELPYSSLNNDVPDIYGGAKDHHIGEVSVLRTDGARYIYGLPAYNISQEELSFAVGPNNENPFLDHFPVQQRLDHEAGIIRYTQKERSLDNNRGTDNYYSNTVTPAYAHSFLLSAILAPDYVDIDNVKGPSDGDIGGYTRFVYKKLEGNYYWRVPFENFMGNFSEGFKSDEYDDKANLIFGEKEIWYLEKIITKNSVAIFTTEPRKDGFGANDIEGGLGPKSVAVHLLRKISLYSKPEYDQNPLTAVPVKEVHFEYDYSLCPDVPNNNGVAELVNGTDINLAKGKLTLKKLYFTYGTSKKAKFSPYDFTYSSFNPAYGLKNYDRWGNFKSNTGGSYLAAGTTMHSAEYPYVLQDKTQADQFASAWLLKEIALPSGGKITVDYESDDYAFVQDRDAMEMVKVVSLTSKEEVNEKLNANPPQSLSAFISSPGSRLYEQSGTPNNKEEKNVLFFPLRKQIDITAGAKAEFARRYLGDIEKSQLYFRFLVDITDDDDYEYISGYAEIADYGVFSHNSTKNNYGWIELKLVNRGDAAITPDVQPIAKATWQFARNYLPRKIDETTGDTEKALGLGDEATTEAGAAARSVIGVLKKLANASIIKGVVETIAGANGALRMKDYGKHVKLDKSFIRLLTPDRIKLGGGSRVTQIKIKDSWNQMVTASGNNESVYGKKYSYTTTDKITNELISSGVAVNEPTLGGDENPLRQPDFFGNKQEKVLAPDDKHYLEFPYGESMYPSPSVGYSKVTVTDYIQANDVPGPKPVNRHATGSIVKEFYTARDFPVISRRTGMDIKRKKTIGALKIFKLNTKDFVTVSQGYSIELNDMHGKPKADWVYAEGETRPMSGMIYKYKSKAYGKSSFQLSNDATVIKPDGTKEVREIGVEYDMIMDFREQETKNSGGGVDGNLAGFLAAILPCAIPTVIPVYSKETTRFRSAVATKVIQRYGLLEETIAMDLGSSVPTKNLAYDSETGQVLLTMTKNEFNDDIYTMQYPAHWYYDGMGAAYKNIGITLSGIAFNASGEASISDASKYFVPGDEVVSSGERGWVSNISGNTVTFINNLGLPYKPSSSANSIKIVRSGRRNILSANIGSVTTLVNPINGIAQNHFASILSSGVQTFKEGWKTECECFAGSSDFMMVSKNDYAIGKKGVWRPYESYAYLTDRQHSFKNANTNIRVDGTFSAYNPYWKVVDGKWVIDNSNWTPVTHVTEYSPYGAELENMDALERYSAAVYGYNHSLPTAVSSNAKYSEIGFDGMEDYDFINCASDHFSYKHTSPTFLDGVSHTGKKALSIQPGTPKVLTKSIVPCQ